MDQCYLPPRFFYSLNLKFFSFNNRHALAANLWCLCSKDLNHFVVSNSNQFVACIVEIGNKNFGIASIYALTSYIDRRELWLISLSLLWIILFLGALLGTLIASTRLISIKGFFLLIEVPYKFQCLVRLK